MAGDMQFQHDEPKLAEQFSPKLAEIILPLSALIKKKAVCYNRGARLGNCGIEGVAEFPNPYFPGASISHNNAAVVELGFVPLPLLE